MSGFFEKHGHKIEYGAPSGCWLWTAGTNGRGGYGLIRVRGRARYAHRAAYETIYGEGSADGLVVRHKCDTPACVNPDHLEIGTQADNLRDMTERGRRKFVPRLGSANGRSKLSEADVMAIRATYVRGTGACGQVALARQFGVSQQVIGGIVNRKTWAHVA